MIDVSALKINVNNYFEGFNLNSFARLSAFFISTTYSNTSSTSPRKNELNVLLIEYGFSKTSSRVLAIANILVIEFLKSSKEFATSCRSPSSFLVMKGSRAFHLSLVYGFSEKRSSKGVRQAYGWN
jgi:hypothetical protein